MAFAFGSISSAHTAPFPLWPSVQNARSFGTEGNRENGATSASVGLGSSLDLLFVNSVNFCGYHENSQEPQTYAVTYGAMFLIFGFTNRVMHDMDSLCL